MPLRVFSSTKFGDEWNQQSRLWRSTKECVLSENSCLKNFVNFQEKHQNRTGFTRNTHECWLLQSVFAGKCFDQKIFFKKYLIRFDIQWHVLPGIKCITEVWRPFTMFIFVCTWFVRFTSLVLYSSGQGVTSRAFSRLHIQLFYLNKKFPGGE